MERSNAVVIAIAVGLALGIALDLLTFLVARYGLSGGDEAPWSFRGNGALIVPFGLGPTVLAGVWTAVLLNGREGVRWLTWSLVVFGVGAAFMLLSVVATVSGNLTAQSVSTFAVLVWPCVGPLLMMIAYGRQPPADALGRAIALVAFTVASLAGFVLANQLLPPGS
jgi:hypothetical protein